MSKILTAKQVASTRARASEYRTVRREIESLCDSHEALRTALKECVEAYYCDPAIKANDGRMVRALTAAKEALGNG